MTRNEQRRESESGAAFVISVQTTVLADDYDEAQRAAKALERAAKRAGCCDTFVEVHEAVA